MKTTRRKDGRLERLITLHDAITGAPIHKHIYAATTDELNRKAARIRAEYAELSPTKMTVGKFIEYYLNCRSENGTDTSTIGVYRQLYRIHIQNTPFAKMRLDSVNIPACRQFLQQFQPRRGKGGRAKQMLYGFLHLSFRQAWKERLIKENPWDFIDKPKHTAAERLTLTPEEFEKLMEHINTWPMDRLFRFAHNTGLRRGEICGLQIQDLHLDQGYISVRQAIKKVDGRYTVGSPKTKTSIRNVPIPKSIVKLLQEQLEFLYQNGYNIGKTGYVFAGDQYEFLAPDTVTRAFTRARQQAGLPDTMSFHSLRATVATYLAELDFNPAKIQAKLGHATPTMTMTRYIKKTPDMLDSMTEALENF